LQETPLEVCYLGIDIFCPSDSIGLALCETVPEADRDTFCQSQPNLFDICSQGTQHSIDGSAISDELPFPSELTPGTDQEKYLRRGRDSPGRAGKQGVIDVWGREIEKAGRLWQKGAMTGILLTSKFVVLVKLPILERGWKWGFSL
jgi:hypothetical protein